MSFKWKGGMAAAAFLLVSLLAITPRAIAGDLMYGDADLSAAVDGGDLGKVVQCVSNANQCPGNADATGDDCSIRASDAFALQKHLAFGNALPIKDPGTVPGCWCVDLSGPGTVSVPLGGSAPVPATLSINVTPPRGGLDCAGVVVDFAITVNPGGCTIDPSAVTDGSCNATATISGCDTLGSGEIEASVDLRDTGGGLLHLVTGNIPFDVESCTITSVVPITGCTGVAVTITGSNFGASQGSGYVQFDTTDVTENIWGDTSIEVVAPGGSFSNVTVYPDAGGSCSLADSYYYDDDAPTATINKPTEGGAYMSPVTSDIDCSETGTCLEKYDSGTWQACETITSLSLGAHTIEARCTDDCGNVGNVTPPVNFTVTGGCGCGTVAGDPTLLESQPRNGPSNLPPTSVTLNMPTQAYLRFVYDQSINPGVSANIGSVALATTNCGDDTLEWTATLEYERDYDDLDLPSLTISNIVACDDSTPVADINLTLRTARDLTPPPGVQGQTGEGFLDGTVAGLDVWVFDEWDGSVIQNAVVQLNNTVTPDGPGYLEEVQATNASGYVQFIGSVVPLNAPVMLTAIAPEHQYFTLANLDARQVVMALRVSGYGLTKKGDTQIIGDFDPAGFNSGIHPLMCRPNSSCSGGYFPNPQRIAFAYLGFTKPHTLLEEGDLTMPSAAVMQHVIIIDSIVAQMGNLMAPDFVTDRYDIPSGSSLNSLSFYRLPTRESGRDMYVSVAGASENPHDVDLPGQIRGEQTIAEMVNPRTISCMDIQRINVPSLADGSCQTIVVDSTVRGVTQDDCSFCNGCNTILSRGQRMNLNHYNFGWSGNSATESNWTPAVNEPNFTYDYAIRVNMSNPVYDPEKSERWWDTAGPIGRVFDEDHNGSTKPDIVRVLQVCGLDMGDGNIVFMGPIQASRMVRSPDDIASKVHGYPDISAIESDLVLSNVTPWCTIQYQDFEVRASLHTPTSMPDPAATPNEPVVPTSEWIPFTTGIHPLDPGARSGTQNVWGFTKNVEYDQVGPEPVLPDNELIDRLFEWYEVTAAGTGNYSVIGDGADYDPVGHPGVDVDPEFNGEIVMIHLIDSCSTLPDQVFGTNCAIGGGDDYWGEDDGGRIFGIWQDNPLEPSASSIWSFDEDGGPGGGCAPSVNTEIYRPDPNKVWRILAPSNVVAGGTLSFYLPRVPTVSELELPPLSLPDGSIYTFESLTETGIPDQASTQSGMVDGYYLEWEYNAGNLPTGITMQNYVTPEYDRLTDQGSQNRQNLRFRR